MKPNVLLIMVDQMRGDCLGINGHPVVETPNLDNLAHKGVRFTNAYSATPSCIPARAALLTGLTQRTHGRVGYEDGVPWNYDHYLAGEFAAAGYHTQCIGKMHVFPTRSLCGFHNIELHDGYLHEVRRHSVSELEGFTACDDYLPWLRQRLGPEADMIDLGLGCNSWVARPWMYPEHLHPTNWTVDRSIDFLRRRDPTKPFFMMTSFVRPHSPLDPPKAYYDQYINQEFPDVPIGDWVDAADTPENHWLTDCYDGKLDPRALNRARAAYHALITHIDHQIGRLLEALFEYEVAQNTIILFTSDHGDLMGDHNMFRKNYPYQGAMNVPFILYDPNDLLHLQKGADRRDLVELRDVMPTLLECAGIPIPDCVEGKSVLPMARGEKTEWRDYIHGEHSRRENSYQTIVTQKYKYIWFSDNGREQFFDLENDPTELHNLIEEKGFQEEIDRCRKLLIQELTGREEGYTDGKQLIVGRQPLNCLAHIRSL